jgi:hypothetical protein
LIAGVDVTIAKSADPFVMEVGISRLAEMEKSAKITVVTVQCVNTGLISGIRMHCRDK